MRILKIVSIISIIVTIASYSYANFDIGNTPYINHIQTNDDIIYTSSSEVSPNTEFYLILNLSKIEYNDFKVRIINNSNAVAKELPTDIKNVSIANKEISFSINKSNVSLEKIGIVYTSPAEEGVLEFNVEIINQEDNLSKWKAELSNIETEITNLKETLASLNRELENLEKVVVENTISNTNTATNVIENSITNEILNTITIVPNENENKKEAVKKQIEETEKSIKDLETKKKDLENKISNLPIEEKISKTISISVAEKTKIEEMDEKNKFDMKDFEKDKDMSQMEKMMKNVEELEGSLKVANQQISNLTNTNIYQGSQNNYLSSLSIDGINLKSEFKKTTNTYFAEVDSSVTTLKINTKAEDSSSIVTIYGNTDLKVGQNKIIINVTAENGSVRTYKVYINKKG